MTKAILKNYRQSPRKVRLIADAIRGKKVDVALTELQFMAKKAADPVKKVLESAVANAKNIGLDTKSLIIKEVTVDEGVTLKRWRPKWRGTAHPIRKRTSHVKIVLGTKDDKKQVVSEEKTEKAEEVKEEKKPTKKVAKKVTKKSAKKVTKDKK
jgi:large subunit ribosomal protein L22